MPVPLVPIALGAIRVGAALIARSRAVSAAKIAVDVTRKTKAGTSIRTIIKNPGVKVATVNAKALKGTGKLATAVAAPSLATKLFGLAGKLVTAGPIGTGLSALAGGAAYWFSQRNKTPDKPSGGTNKGGNKGGHSASKLPKSKPIPSPNGYKFNLPPHNWSLPTRPVEVIGDDVNATGYAKHGLRRGRIWYYDNAGVAQSVDRSTGQVSSVGKTGSDRSKNYKDPKGSFTIDSKTYQYGFQFLWNPESISLSVNRNMDITPSAADVYTSVSGAFPGQESVSFTIILDRTNDFACLRGNYAQAITIEDGRVREFKEPFANWSTYASYYTSGKDPRASREPSVGSQIEELARLGTMHDLEYLLKAINGDGYNATNQAGGWTNLLGKQTADIGYLQPSLLAFELGGDTIDSRSQNSLSYVGWISSLSVNHTAFTEGMIPIRTTVSIAFDCFAGSTII